MTSGDKAEIKRRVKEETYLATRFQNPIKDAEELYAASCNGYFHRTPRFYFNLALACLDAAGLDPKPKGQEEL